MGTRRLRNAVNSSHCSLMATQRDFNMACAPSMVQCMPVRSNRSFTTCRHAGLQTLAQVRAFVECNAPVSFTLTDRIAAHQWMMGFNPTSATRGKNDAKLLICRFRVAKVGTTGGGRAEDSVPSAR